MTIACFLLGQRNEFVLVKFANVLLALFGVDIRGDDDVCVRGVAIKSIFFEFSFKLIPSLVVDILNGPPLVRYFKELKVADLQLIVCLSNY